jgi:pimeloyl-ACP methyl ester carboxylesterase
LAKLGVIRAIIVGFSWSGALACSFALDHADLVQGVVLLAPVIRPWRGRISWYYRSAATPLLGVIFTWIVSLPAGLWRFSKTVRKVFVPARPPVDHVKRTGALMVLRPREFSANAQDVAGLKAFVATQAPRLAAIWQPTVIIAGSNDRIVATNLHTHYAARTIPNARLSVVKRAGHLLHYSDPDKVVEAITEVAQRSR